MKAVQVAVFDDVEHKTHGTLVPAAETAMLGWKGEWREVDLSAENYRLLYEHIKRFFYAGHKPGDPVALPKDQPGGAWAFYKGLREWADKEGRSAEYRLKGGKGTGYTYDNKLRSDYRAYLASLPVTK